MDICVSHIPVSNIKYVKEIIDAGCMSQFFNIESLCRDVGISHAHLLRLFKKEYGLTLINYVIKKRVMYACELLETTRPARNGRGIFLRFSGRRTFYENL